MHELLAADAECLATRRKNIDLPGAAQQPLHEVRDLVDNVLTVVDDQQDISMIQTCRELGDGPLPASLLSRRADAT
ncbi:hypothetical protein ACR6C2_05075 [Streptomyces sp. INA 01156]